MSIILLSILQFESLRVLVDLCLKEKESDLTNRQGYIRSVNIPKSPFLLSASCFHDA